MSHTSIRQRPIREPPVRHAAAWRAGAVGLGLLALAAAGKAHGGQTQVGSITILGGAVLAEECSRAAIAGLLDDRSDQTCTQSLQTETLSPHDMAATLVNRGVIRMRRGALEAAHADFDMAIRVAPHLGEAYVNRGAAEIAQHRAGEGLADLNRALALGLHEPEKAYFNRAVAYEELDNPKAAYFDYVKAQELAPDWPAPKEQLVRFTVVRR